MNSDALQLHDIPVGREGWVYLIHAVGTDRYKIGRSVNPVARLETLKSQSPYPLKVINSFWTIDAYTDELELHDEFAENRVHGEWFDFSEANNESVWIDDSGHLSGFCSFTVGFLSFGFTQRLISELPGCVKGDKGWLNSLVVRTCCFANSSNDFNRIAGFIEKVGQRTKVHFAYGCPNPEIAEKYILGLFDGFCMATFNRGVFDNE